MQPLCAKLALAAPLALLLAAAVAPTPSAAQANSDTKVKASDDRSMQIFKRGDDFIAVVYRPDGSAVIGVVTAPKRDGAGKRPSNPDMADLLKNGQVKYTLQLAPQNTSLAKSIAENLGNVPPMGISPAPTAAAKPSKGKPGAQLTRTQKSDLARQVKATAKVLDTIGKGIGDGAEVR